MTKGINTDIAAGMIGLGFTALFWFALEDISRLSIIFPKSMVIIMALISVGLLINGFVSPSRSKIFTQGGHKRIVVTGLTLFLWVMAINKIGFYVSSVVAFSFLTYYLALARRKVTLGQFLVWVLIIAAEVAIFYIIFTRLIYNPLPKGFLL
jgi:hypothetical protein